MTADICVSKGYTHAVTWHAAAQLINAYDDYVRHQTHLTYVEWSSDRSRLTTSSTTFVNVGTAGVAVYVTLNKRETHTFERHRSYDETQTLHSLLQCNG